jgi:hypothetical protein
MCASGDFSGDTVKAIFNAVASAALALALSALPAAAGFINFDNLTSGNPVGPSYDGFTWGGNWTVWNQSLLRSQGNTTTFPSGADAASNEGANVVDLIASTPTVFNSAAFASWGRYDSFQSYSSTNITVQGWNGTALLWTASEALSPSTFTDLAFGAAAVTDLKFLSDGTNNNRSWLVDNISFTAAPAAVPEPGTLLLFATGLLGFGLLRRRKSGVTLPAPFAIARS